MLGTRLGFTFLGTPLTAVKLQFKLHPLQLQRQCTDLTVLFKLVNGLLDCPDILGNIALVVPRGNRSMTIFHRRYEPTYYAYHGGMSRLLRLGSEATTWTDFFGISLASFKIAILTNVILSHTSWPF
ncbi:hypothetical protein J6590_067224 [Homalodisca vitripennis]|nr:hypothetical protein J6590_067224 [Homalodisca vitripennis]